MAQQIDIIKRPNQIEHFTPEQIKEFKKCKKDPIYFIKKYILVQHPKKGRVPLELYPYQEEMIRAFQNNDNTILLAARQVGKCVYKDTFINLKSPEGKVYKIKVEHFYEWQKFKDAIKDICDE